MKAQSLLLDRQADKTDPVASSAQYPGKRLSDHQIEFEVEIDP
jgi:hypothetical protein